jgi:hypothetical protein
MNTWNIGIARADITPQQPIPMAGWGGRRISEEVRLPLWAKALALQDAQGVTAVLVTTDLLGLSRSMSEQLAQRAQQKFGLQRQQLIINSSHNHAGPVTGDLLHLYYVLTDSDLETIAQYTEWLLDQIIDLIGQSLDSLAPGTLSFESGLCGFGVNRRRDRLADSRDLAQVVDHDVPVLAVRDMHDNIRAIAVGYACHPTSFALPQISGDWPGIAQRELESIFPDTTVLFVAGCGGDINPLPRFGKYHEELPEMFGKILAASVCNVLENPMQPLEAALQLQFEEATLQLETPPSSDEFQAARDALDLQETDSVNLRGLNYQLAAIEHNSVATQIPYPVHVWQLGTLHFIALSGEPVVDYSLSFKKKYGFQTTWVAGYCNELTSYIPSLRVLREGGYEGKTGMLEYGWPAAFDETVETCIVTTVENLMKKP